MRSIWISTYSWFLNSTYHMPHNILFSSPFSCFISTRGWKHGKNSTTPLVQISWSHHKMICFCWMKRSFIYVAVFVFWSGNRALRIKVNGRTNGSLSYGSWREGARTKAHPEETCHGELGCEGRGTSLQMSHKAPVHMLAHVYRHEQFESPLYKFLVQR